MHAGGSEHNSRIRSLLMTSIGTIRSLRLGEQSRPLPELKLPLELGDYRLIERVGQGQSARVYRATFRRMASAGHTRQVAVKLFRAVTTNEHFELVREEALRADRVRSEHVVRVFDVGLWQERFPYVVQDFWEAENLEEWALRVFAENHPLPSIEFCLGIVLGAARGVQAAHAQEVIHRDIAPRNILVCKDGVTRITDFGCASLGERDRDTEVVGTPSFMPPEQWRRGAHLKQSDIAALGGILFWLITGHLPYGDTPEAIERAHQAPSSSHATQALALAESRVPQEVATAILRATDPDLIERTVTIEQFIEELEACRLALAPRQSWPWRRLAVAAALLLVAFGGYRTLIDHQPLTMPVHDSDALAEWFGRDAADPDIDAFRYKLALWGATALPATFVSPRPADQLLALAASRRWKIEHQPEPLPRAAIAMTLADLAFQAEDGAAIDRWLAVARDALNARSFDSANSGDLPERLRRVYLTFHAARTIEVRTEGGDASFRDAVTIEEARWLIDCLTLGLAKIKDGPAAGFSLVPQSSPIHGRFTALAYQLVDAFRDVFPEDPPDLPPRPTRTSNPSRPSPEGHGQPDGESRR
jgi:serine/threonine protein kinase